jgi:hypothetical protein
MNQEGTLNEKTISKSSTVGLLATTEDKILDKTVMGVYYFDKVLFRDLTVTVRCKKLDQDNFPLWLWKVNFEKLLTMLLDDIHKNIH